MLCAAAMSSRSTNNLAARDTLRKEQQMDTQLPAGSTTKLWVTFKLDGEDYCISNDSIVALLIPTEIKEMPNDPDYIMGVMEWGANGTLPIVDLRKLLGMQSLSDSVNQFALMRQMHVDWIDALRDSVENGTPFEKAIDPHKCLFGRWYDNFHSNNISMRFILAKIGPPHEYIHRHGAEVKALMAKGDMDGAKAKYNEAYKVCTTEVLPLLDELIQTYKEVNRGIVIAVRYNNQIMGLMADEIGALVPVDKSQEHPVPAAVQHSPYIEGMMLANGVTYAVLDVSSLASAVDDKDAVAKELEQMRQ